MHIRFSSAQTYEEVTQKILHAFVVWRRMGGPHTGGVSHTEKGIQKGKLAANRMHGHQPRCFRSRYLPNGLMVAQYDDQGFILDKNLGVSTTSHHLSRLAKAGLVSARTDGHYYLYSLQMDALQKMAQRLLKEEDLSRLSQEVDMDAYDQKVLANFTDAEGKIKAFPTQEKKYLVLLRYVVKAFEPVKHYTEKQVNEILARYNRDTAMLRRILVEYHFMERISGGCEYWLKEEE